MAGPVLEVEGLAVEYATPRGPLRALRGVSFAVTAGEAFGLAGESGSGKSTLAYAIMGALGSGARIAAGDIRFEGRSLRGLAAPELRALRGRRVAMVYQDPPAALNPAVRVGRQVAEALEVHGLARGAEARARALGLLELVRIPDPPRVARQYPHQLSGGMQQRVVIAMALACDPALLILDEPTTGLDVTTQARILELVAELRRRVRAAILYISHDLGVIAQVSDRVGILYAGELVEVAPAEALFARPHHPYTRGLLEALPRLDRVRALRPIPGALPDLTRVPAGCAFAPRCAFVEPACRAQAPALVPAGPGRLARCFRWLAVATAAEPAEEPPPVPREAARVSPALLVGEGLVKLHGEPGWLARRLGLAPPPVAAVDGVTLEVRRGEVLALVGESGCGKTTLGRLMARLWPPTAGRVRLLDPATGAEVVDARAARRAVQAVFQNPEASLNPTRRVRAILGRPLVLLGVPRAARGERLRTLLEAVRLDASYLDRFPRQLSGGEKQRVAIARAFALEPRVVVLDEPVSALDVSTQASVVALLGELRARLDAAYLFISHDLALVRQLADRVAVMYLGQLVEVGTVAQVFAPPFHPYTRALLSAVPVPDPARRGRAVRLEGPVPNARRPPAGCRFHTRCPEKLGPVCETAPPPLLEAAPGHRIACHIPLEVLRREPPVAGAPGPA